MFLTGKHAALLPAQRSSASFEGDAFVATDTFYWHLLFLNIATIAAVFCMEFPTVLFKECLNSNISADKEIKVVQI